MSQNLWTLEQIKLCEHETGQALLSDESTLVSFSQDFGKLVQSQPSAVCTPKDVDALQSLIQFASQQKLPITIRGKGLSQCGQSLPVPGGLTLSMEHFDKPLECNDENIWVEANTTWAAVLEQTLPRGKAPYVLPYNCNLAVGGVLSVGGVGASSFRHGTINAHVSALEVVDGTGKKHLVDKSSPLFYACLSGQGRFGVITKACVELRPIKQNVKTVCLVYTDQKQWFEDIYKAHEHIDYMELFCSPSVQGTKLHEGKRVPLVQWLYGMHLSVEYHHDAPSVEDIVGPLKPWNQIHSHEETNASYLLRHNPRFELMKMLGQWELFHPWYECFVPVRVLKEHLADMLEKLPVHYASFVHVVPIAKKKAGFLMFPEDEPICSLMILNPGVPEAQKESAIEAVHQLDKRLIALGGKRYLSGFLGNQLPANYWEKHFGEQHDSWVGLKHQFDPAGIFKSLLYPQ